MSAKIMPLSDGAEVVFIKNGRFNTTLVSFNFYMPLTREHAAEYALLPFVLTPAANSIQIFQNLILSYQNFTEQSFQHRLKKSAIINCLKFRFLLLMTDIHLITNHFAAVQYNCFHNWYLNLKLKTALSVVRI